MTVARFNYPASNLVGYQVRTRSLNGKYSSVYFADKKYGGAKKAYKKALEYAQEYCEKHKDDKLSLKRNPYLNRLAKNNKSGITGVFHTSLIGGSGNTLFYWVASIKSPTNSYIQIRFSVLQYGEEVAKEKAENFRKAWEKAVDTNSLKSFFKEDRASF